MSQFYLAISLLGFLLHSRHCQCFTQTVRLTESTGNITTPGYPNGFPQKASFRWDIVVGKEEIIWLKIKDLDLRKCGSNDCGECDVLDIFDGYSFYTFCDITSKRSSIFSRGNTMSVDFYSGNAAGNESRGLWLSYVALPNEKKWWTIDPTTLPIPKSTPFLDLSTGDGPSQGYSSFPSNLLLLIIIALVLLLAMVLSCIAIKRRFSRPMSQQRDPNEDHPCSFTAPSADLHLTDDEFQRRVSPPPSYEEAARCQSPSSNNSIPHPLSHSQSSTVEVEPYDATGLPSYDEALKISTSNGIETDHINL